jgi:zinc transport system permease protein
VTPTWADFVEGFELFRDPILCGVVAGAVLGFLSFYIVLRRLVFVSAAVTQSAGLGVALAFYVQIHLGLEIDPLVGAIALALASNLLLAIDPKRLRLTRETMLGLVYALAGGAAVLVGARISQEAHDIQAILLGSAVLVRPVDLYAVLGTGGVVLALQLWWFRGFVFASFDPDGARIQRLPVALLQAVLFVSIGLMVGVSARALGALPVFALSTLPAVAALLLGARSPRWTSGLAALFGAVAGGGGYLLAFFEDLPVGASQTVTATSLAAAALLVRVVVRRR